MDPSVRWRENWRVLASSDSVPVEVPLSSGMRTKASARVRTLRSGTPVVLLASSLGSLRRCRRFASTAGIRVEREYVPLPSMQAPRYIVENTPRSLEYFWSTLATVPPGKGEMVAGPAEALFRLTRALVPLSVLGWLAPGCISVGRRT